MVMHHPSVDFLTAHAAGILPVAQSACVSAHLTYCEKCRRSNAQLQAIGGVFFEQLAPTPVSESVLDNVLARLDEPEPLHFADTASIAKAEKRHCHCSCCNDVTFHRTKTIH